MTGAHAPGFDEHDNDVYEPRELVGGIENEDRHERLDIEGELHEEVIKLQKSSSFSKGQN